MERIPLHSWEMEFSIQYHVTINSQLNDQNSIKYYCDQRASTSERAGSILISDMGEQIVFNTFFRWNVYSIPFAGSFYPYMELVTIYGVPHTMVHGVPHFVVREIVLFRAFLAFFVQFCDY